MVEFHRLLDDSLRMVVLGLLHHSLPEQRMGSLCALFHHSDFRTAPYGYPSPRGVREYHCDQLVTKSHARPLSVCPEQSLLDGRLHEGQGLTVLAAKARPTACRLFGDVLELCVVNTFLELRSVPGASAPPAQQSPSIR